MADTNLFIKQCEVFIETLEEAKKESTAKLTMSTFIQKAKENNHFCNSAACICGYVAILKNLEFFQETEKYLKQNYFLDNLDLLRNSASSIASEFGDSSPNLQLANSIYDGYKQDRKHYATNCGLFTDLELSSLNHLNKTPSFNDAIEYIKLCVVKTKENYL